MKKFVRLLAAFGAAVCMLGTARVYADTNQAVLDARHSVVRVMGVSYDQAGNIAAMATGSGFAVGEEGEDVRYFVTNDHCVSGRQGDWVPDEVYIVFDSLENSQSVVLARPVYKTDQVGEDIAILAIEKPVSLRQPAVLGSVETVHETDTVYALGFPGGTDDFTRDRVLKSGIDQCTVKTGHVTRVKGGDYRGSDFLVFEGQINGGNSGGPLVNELGEVIGINTIASAQNYADDGALYIDDVKEILDRNHISYQSAQDSREAAGVAKAVKGHGFLLVLAVAVAVLVLAAALLAIRKLSGSRRKQRTALFDEDPYLSDDDISDTNTYGGDDDIHYL